MSKRQYTKKSSYWDERKKESQKVEASAPKQYSFEASAEFDENAHFTAQAACGGGSVSNSYRDSFSGTLIDNTRFKNLRQGVTPYLQKDGYYSVSEAIELSALAYFNVPIVRNAINLFQDFSISNIQIKCSNKTVKRFFQKWFEALNLNDFMSQYFLEYYRSGNVFIYKFNGRISKDKMSGMDLAEGAKTPSIPIRYIILNPSQVVLQVGPSYSQNFARMLSTYEIQRLRNPQTEEDKEVLKSFPPAIQKQIKTYSSYGYIYAPLETKRLYYVFYRKQDYEPLAVPMIFPVLSDIELKLELKKMDASLARMLEQVILLVTTGDKADQYNAGLNPKNLAALKNIFKNQTIGRVLVADYTTKAEWKIPDMKELLGPDKYKRVDADIREGLQYMFFGEEKFANAAIKAKIFVESLKEGRRTFMENFLMPEVRKVCEAMKFKTVPKLIFEKIDIEDKNVLQRLYFQMAQTGLLTDSELNNALETGILPSKTESLEHQATYKAEREKGFYKPLVGGGKDDGGDGRPAGTKTPQSTKNVSPIGTSKAHQISLKGLIDTIAPMNALEEAVASAFKKKYKLKELDETQNEVVTLTASAIVLNEKQEDWNKSVKSYLTDPKIVSDKINRELQDIKDTYSVDDWTAIAIKKSLIKGNE